MRQLHIEVPSSAADDAVRRARAHDGINLWHVATESEDDVALVVAHLPNDKVGPFIQSLEGVDDVRITLLPRGV